MREKSPIPGVPLMKLRFTISQFMIVIVACGLLLAYPLLLMPALALGVAFGLRQPNQSSLRDLQFAALVGVAIVLAFFAFLVPVWGLR